MASSLRDDAVLSDSEYESALSHPSTPLGIELEGMLKPPPTSGEVIQRKLRRDTGLPSLRFPQRGGNQDVEKLEDDVNQLLPLGKTIRDEAEEPKKDAPPEQESTATNPETSTSNPTQLDHQALSKKSHTRNHSISFSSRISPPEEDVIQEPDQNPPGDQNPTIHALQQSLNTIRTHVTTLESAINANITTQLQALSTSNIPVLDADSLPSFKAENKNRECVGAVLNTVKVACAVERGLEALVATLEMGKEGWKKDLMEACLRKPEDVALEMQRAVVGMRKVLKSKSI